jgi:prevent-host-death family protein
MKRITITDARKHFRSMLDSAMREPVLITRRNKKGAVIMSIAAYKRMTGTTALGFMAGQISVPDDFDRMSQEKIQRMFKGKK